MHNYCTLAPPGQTFNEFIVSIGWIYGKNCLLKDWPQLYSMGFLCHPQLHLHELQLQLQILNENNHFLAFIDGLSFLIGIAYVLIILYLYAKRGQYIGLNCVIINGRPVIYFVITPCSVVYVCLRYLRSKISMPTM